MLTILIIITTITLVGFVIYDLAEIAIEKRKLEKEEELRMNLEKHRELEEKRMELNSAYKAKLEELVSSYGPCTTDILLGSFPTNIESHMFIFEESSMLVLKGEKIPFAKVLGFTLNDDSETIIQNETRYTSITKTNTGNMLSRAVVGGILLGGVGALAGATTAKKETVTVPTKGMSTSETKHHYILFVNLDDLSNPTRVIRLDSDTKLAHNIANIFNIIIQRNQK